MATGLSEAAVQHAPGALVLVVGASGVGKDTMLAGAAQKLRDRRDIAFVRRCITRPAHASEDFQSMTREAFERARASGEFSMTWEAHGLSYGVPAVVAQDVGAGRTVVLNASRRVVSQARQQFVRVFVTLVECAAHIRAERMAARQRESMIEIVARLSRTVEDFDAGEADVVIDNSGPPEIAVAKFSEVLVRIASQQAA